MSDRVGFWAAHVAAQVGSGASQRAYCAQHGIRPRNFRRWAQRLRGRGEGAAPVTSDTGGLAEAVEAEAVPRPGAGAMASTRAEAGPLPRPAAVAAEVLAYPERRRRWTPEQKLQLVMETLDPGASLSMVARRHGVHSSVLFRWRRQLATRVPGAHEAVRPAGAAVGGHPAPRLVPVRVAPAPVEVAPVPSHVGSAVPALAAADTPAVDDAAATGAGRMEIELAGGARVRVDRHVDMDALRRVLAALGAR